MQEILKKHITPENLHHAYALVGRASISLEQVVDFLCDQGLCTKDSPDTFLLAAESLGIDDVRELRIAQSTQPTTSSRKFCIVQAETITREAQNSLLKILEEPSGHTHFILLVPDDVNMLPTLRSRLSIVYLGDIEDIKETAFAKKFLSLSIKERLDILKKRLQSKKETMTKDQGIVFLNILERELYNQLKQEKKFDAQLYVFSMLYRARDYLYGQGMSLKMILEHVALVTPKM